MRSVVFSMVLAFAVAVGVSYAGDAAKGETLFNTTGKCKVCHKTDANKLVGPGLAGVTKSFDDAFLKEWISDSQGTWAKGGPAVEAIQKKANKVGKPKTAMAPGKLTAAEVDDVIAYLHKL
ncbi:MAG: cytochrome c [Candidatus Nitrosotenuis sp.]|nr:MAG: cytochrome c [Candidatus Nitrosotenuis sp.]